MAACYAAKNRVVTINMVRQGFGGKLTHDKTKKIINHLKVGQILQNCLLSFLNLYTLEPEDIKPLKVWNMFGYFIDFQRE